MNICSSWNSSPWPNEMSHCHQVTLTKGSCTCCMGVLYSMYDFKAGLMQNQQFIYLTVNLENNEQSPDTSERKLMFRLRELPYFANEVSFFFYEYYFSVKDFFFIFLCFIY